MTYPALPVFLPLEGRKCVVIGGGIIAARKAADLIETGAVVTVVAAQPGEDIETLAAAGSITLYRRRYSKGDLAGATVAFGATDDEAVNAAVAAEGKDLGVWVNIVDDPKRCDFYSGAVVGRGPLRVAISTSGACPALAASVRRTIEQHFDPAYGDFVTLAGDVRSRLGTLPDLDPAIRMAVLEWLADREAYDLFASKGNDAVWQVVNNKISSSQDSHTDPRP